MANQEHLNKLMEGVQEWNQWREENLTAQIDLSGVFYSGSILVGLDGISYSGVDLSGINLSNANLRGAGFHGTILRGADFNGADLREATLTADLSGATLVKANISGVDLSRADLHGVTLSLATLVKADLRYAKLSGVDLQGADLREATLRYADLRGANLQGADLSGADLTGANLQDAHLFRVHLSGANLVQANLNGTNLQNAILTDADLSSATLVRADLREADLRRVFFDRRTDLSNVVLSDEVGVSSSVVDIHWDDVNLAVVNWELVKKLGDEYQANESDIKDPNFSQEFLRELVLDGYQAAVRANRQLAVVLRDQGLNEEADHFAYRAQLLQRKVLWREHEFGRWLFSMLLALMSGYGYRIWRILAAYLLTVSVFALVYFVLGRYYPPHLPLHQAFLESITAFHGRVFFEQFNLDTPQIWFTALEAVAGLIIEGVFIAMLIQRFFGR